MNIKTANQALDFAGSPFEQQTIDIHGIPTRIYKNQTGTIQEVIEQTAAHGDADYIVYQDERLTFSQHLAQVRALSAYLINHYGIKKGDRVAIAMRNYPEWVVAFWSVCCAGAIVVPLNAWLRGRELEYCLEDSGSRLLIADDERLAVLQPHFANLPNLQHIVISRAQQLPEGAEHWQQMLQNAMQQSDGKMPQVDTHPDDDATIFYTSGTTGRPKGALGTQRNFIGNTTNAKFLRAREHLLGGGTMDELMQMMQNPPANQGSLLSVPLFHVTGCHSFLGGATMGGNKMVLMHRWDPAEAIRIIEREKLTNFGGVPAMVWQVLESPEFSQRDLSSLLSVGYGGAPAAPDLVARLQQHFPDVQPSNGYGLTETSAITTSNVGGSYRAHPDSVGACVAVCDVKIMSEDGVQEMPLGEIGEIWIRGPNVVRGYWNKPEATAEAFTDGWLHSGDMGYLDAEGLLYVRDRAKDMLIRGGENIYCIEVEDALFSHNDVVDAAVVGIPHKILGEEVGAMVLLKEGATASAEDLMAHVARLLANFKVPIRIDFHDEPLPRNPNGKILKPEVRKLMGLEA